MNIMSVIKGLGECHGKLFLGLLRHLSVCSRMFLFSRGRSSEKFPGTGKCLEGKVCTSEPPL